MVEGGVLVGKAGRMGSASCPIPPASTSGRRTRWRLPCPCVPIGRTRAHSNANQESGGELALARIPYHDYRPERYDEIFRDKVREIEESFESMLSGVEVTAQASAPTHFRLRCRFAVSASVDRDTGETRLVHTLFDRGADRVEVSSFPIASRQINDLMPRLMRHLEGLEGEAAAQVRDGLDAVHYLGTMRGRDVVVTLIYGRPIQGEGWKREATKVSSPPPLSAFRSLGRFAHTRAPPLSPGSWLRSSGSPSWGGPRASSWWLAGITSWRGWPWAAAT